ncbi:hypothetical protein HHI36_022684 [Cryptolaemus montrouzieri]|uniref:Uncharacterized protein n=1 Tax=Cryptolaemus montrouzieri TaxID=559131 RepID=A0ABD2N1K8_9CUCU
MNLSQTDIKEPLEYNEVENKTFVRHFIDANGKMWERDYFHEAHVESTFLQNKNEYRATQPVNVKEIEETKSLMNEFIAGDGEIRNQEMLIKYETAEDFNIEESNGRLFLKLKLNYLKRII